MNPPKHSARIQANAGSNAPEKNEPLILTVNAGSSSIKAALFSGHRQPVRRCTINVERIGLPDPALTVVRADGQRSEPWRIDAPDHTGAFEKILAQLEARTDLRMLRAIGHRVVHGGPHYVRPQLISGAMLEELRRLCPFDPEHLPAEIRLIEIVQSRWPGLPQIACFDTAFHREMPRVARLLAIPRRYFAAGVQRYGFHGLSYEYLMQELRRAAGPAAARARVILAHLGNGASMAAVHQGKSIDTTMGFTPTAGLPMSTRAGDLDPGLVAYLARTEGMSPQAFHHLVNHQSGLLGVSEISSDIRDLLALEERDERAADAVGLFAYQAAKWIGALAAALGGVDTMVFSGGIGENSAVIRERICLRLPFLGIALDKKMNDQGESVISSRQSPVTVRIIKTDEERHIAQLVQGVLKETPVSKTKKSPLNRTGRPYEKQIQTTARS